MIEVWKRPLSGFVFFPERDFVLVDPAALEALCRHVWFAMDRLLLRIPVFGPLVRKSVMARWTRTLSTMFAAGVPLVESLDSVGGAAGNYVIQGGHQADSR